MGISVNSMMSAAINSGIANTVNTPKNAAKIEEKQTNAAKGQQEAYYASEKEAKENQEMLWKMKMSGTKLEALGDYFGSMQKALKDSGSNGMMAYRRTSNLIHNATEYMDTEEYQKKENSKCLVKDLTDSMKEGQEALEKKAEKKKEEKKAETEHEASEEKPVSEARPQEQEETTSVQIETDQSTEQAAFQLQKEKQETKAFMPGSMVDIAL